MSGSHTVKEKAASPEPRDTALPAGNALASASARAPGGNRELTKTVSLTAFFCLGCLSRHYLPPVAASGEKDESEVRTSRAVQKR